MAKRKVPVSKSQSSVMAAKSYFERDAGSESLTLHDVDASGYFRVVRSKNGNETQVAKVKGNSTDAYQVFDAIQMEGF